MCATVMYTWLPFCLAVFLLVAHHSLICAFVMKLLPKEERYAPPFNIRILDKRSFGRQPTVGVHVIKCLDDFHVDPSPGASIKKRE